MISDLADIVSNPQSLIAIFTAIAVFATILTITMPFLQRDELANRMKTVALERDKIRARERARLATQKNNNALRQDNSGKLVRFVDKLNLRKMLADEKTFMNLKMAGYRRQSHVYVFLFFRLVVPIVLLIASTIYVFAVSDMEHSFMIKLLIVLVVGYTGFYLPNMYVSNIISKRQLSIRRAWPDSLDLLLICVEAGMSIEAALNKVAHEIGIQSPQLAEELILTTAELSYLQERRDAYQNLADRTGQDGVKAVCMALIQAERYGTPLSQALRVLSKENRDMRMSEAEKKAASLPPKLTVPMIVFFLPVLFAVIMGPAMIQIFALD